MIELTLPATCVFDCSHSGACDSDVRYWRQESPVREQLEAIAEIDAVCALKGYGAWTPGELEDHEANLQRILWIAAGNAQDDPEWDRESEAYVYLD